MKADTKIRAIGKGSEDPRVMFAQLMERDDISGAFVFLKLKDGTYNDTNANMDIGDLAVCACVANAVVAKLIGE
jgi:hypothetical protein